ncbi:phage tail tape measure protein [Streptomyces sp. NPDC054802]
MAVRTVSVLLTADIAAFRARMNDASRTATRTSRDIRTRMRDAGRAMNRVGQNQRTTLTAIRNTSLGLIAAFGFAVAASARFEKAMASVQAVTGATAGEMSVLRASALEAGRTTKFSAVQAADAQHELAKAGVSTANIAGGALKGALNLAAAAEINVAEGAEIAANAMTVFGMEGKDVSHIADVLAAAANKSTTDVHQMGLSLRMAGQVASQVGLSFEDTAGTLALFASEGLKGSDAGTSLKVMLQRLTPNSKEAQRTMDALGLSAYDANGQFVGLHEMAQRMKVAFSDLTPEARNSAMGVIFGSDAVRGANILYKHGEAGVRKYTDAVNDNGYAQRVASARMNHLLGDLELLKSALETALIQTGTAANAALRDMVQWVTRLVNVYNQLPPGLQQSAGLLTGIIGILGLVGASILLFLPRVMLVRRELVALGITAQVVRGKLLLLGKLGLTLGVLAALSWGIDKLVSRFTAAPPSVTKLTNSLVTFAQKGKIAGEAARLFGDDLDGFGDAVARIAHPGALDRVEDFFGTFDPGTDVGGPGLDAATQKVEALDQALAELVQNGGAKEAAAAFKRYAAAAEAGGTSTEKFRTLLPKYEETLLSADTQTKLAAKGQGELGDAALTTKDAMEDERTEAEKLTEALAALNGVAISSAQAEINFRDSVAEVTEVVKDNGKTLDVNTAKGRAVRSWYLDAADAAIKHAEAVGEQTGSVEAGNAIFEADIALLKGAMKAAGFTAAQINELTSAYAQLPGAKDTRVAAPGSEKTIRDIQTLRDKVIAVPPGKSITIKAPTKEAVKALQAAGYNVKKIPGSKNVKITAPTRSAQENAKSLRRELDRLKNKHLTVNTHFSVTGTSAARQAANLRKGRARGGRVSRYADGGAVMGYPGGGAVFGPGTATSDSIPAWLSNGEFVIRAAAVRRYGTELFERLNMMQMPTARMSAGGMVPQVLSGSRYTSRVPAPIELGPIHAEIKARVFVGDREITDIARTEVTASFRQLTQTVRAGRKRKGA